MQNSRTYQEFSDRALPGFKSAESKGNDFNQILPPWGSLTDWSEANRSLAHLIKLRRVDLKLAMMQARRIQDCLESMFALMDDLCAATCLFCPDPCCLNAKVWFDFRDLLFLHLSAQQIPQSQIRLNLKETCRYHGPRGCTLSRILRPWVCTWYLCPAQVANFHQKPLAVQKNYKQTVKAVKVSRKEMEAEFIRVTVR